MTRGRRTEVNIGDAYNNWTVVSEPFYKYFPSGSKALFVICDCSCGTKGRELRSAALTSENNPSKSCGCLTVEVAKQKRQPPMLGSKFGRLTIIEDLGQVQGKGRTHSTVKVSCECGSESFDVNLNSIRKGHTQSCGCYNKERITETFKTHGLSTTKIYKVWLGINDRCFNENNAQFHDYGGRGITNLWESFEDYFADMGESYFDGCEIDRIDVNGNYCKENCRWTTHSVNNHNRRKRKGCTSEYIGVCFNSKTNKYAAQLVKDGALIIRKEFVNELEAAIAYDNASERVYGDRPNKTTSGGSP